MKVYTKILAQLPIPNGLAEGDVRIMLGIGGYGANGSDKEY